DMQRGFQLSHDPVLVEARRSSSVQRKAPGHFALRGAIGQGTRIDAIERSLDVPDRALLDGGSQLQVDLPAAGVELRFRAGRLPVGLEIRLPADRARKRRFRGDRVDVLRKHRDLAQTELPCLPAKAPGPARQTAALT